MMTTRHLLFTWVILQITIQCAFFAHQLKLVDEMFYVWIEHAQGELLPMIGETRQLATNKPVAFEKKPVEVDDYMVITDHFRRIYTIYPNLAKENRRMWTCNRLDL